MQKRKINADAREVVKWFVQMDGNENSKGFIDWIWSFDSRRSSTFIDFSSFSVK